MKKLIILAAVLALMVMATVVLAVPGENSPWVWYDKNGDGFLPDSCKHPSGTDGV